ncbi:MAG: 50S ribosomal protein L32 [Candidatus Omnitrophica bacterium]|nr:50S ribosomal protein L32 [Candidatus Omnitrophota bacterium]
MPKVKRGHSKSRGRKRRTHYKAEAPALSKCPQCEKAIQPHHVCAYCGYYKAKQIVKIESIEERKEKKEKKDKKG